MDDNHLIDIVDKDNKVIGQATKEEKFTKELISRNVVAFIKNSKGELIIVKRSPHKRSWPNRLDLATCGNVNVGETYEQAIKREIMEEIQIPVKVKLIDITYTETTENGKRLRYFTGVFAGKTNLKPILCDEHLFLRYIAPDKLNKMMDKDPDLFSPSFIKEFKEFASKL